MKVSWSALSTRMRRAIAVGTPIVFAVLITIAYALIEHPDGDGSSAPSTAPISAREVNDLLAKLVVAPEASMAGYSREKFPHWDQNKPEHGFGPEFAQYARCTTRDVMMLRDSTGTVRLDPKTCALTVGSDGGWRDRYGVLDRKTGKVGPYKWITNPSGVDAEHIVPLAEAWRSGAGGRDEDTRRRIANDAINLVASEPSANRSKGDQDVANYLPPGNFRCAYVGRYAQIKVKYSLTVDPAERTALRAAVDDCVTRGGFR
ncbi:HNH endonuclease family protein [Nocardia terpenica]|nr:HNH endonuclease family protein [Nocardia terpenica]